MNKKKKRTYEQRYHPNRAGGKPRSVDYSKILKGYSPDLSLRENAAKLGVSHTLIVRALASGDNSK